MLIILHVRYVHLHYEARCISKCSIRNARIYIVQKKKIAHMVVFFLCSCHMPFTTDSAYPVICLTFKSKYFTYIIIIKHSCFQADVDAIFQK